MIPFTLTYTITSTNVPIILSISMEDDDGFTYI